MTGFRSATKYLLVLTLSAVGAVAAATAGFAQYVPARSWSLLEAEQTAGRQIFKDHCAACHVQKTGTNVVLAPSLHGVVGRQAGSLPGFPYSDALKKSGLRWTEDNLHKWIADNAKMVPNTLMPHVSISDPAEQIYLLAYLRLL